MGPEDRSAETSEIPNQPEPWRVNTETIHTVIPAALVPQYASMAVSLENSISQDDDQSAEVNNSLREWDAEALSKLAKVLEYTLSQKPEGKYLTFNAPFVLSMALMRRQSDWRRDDDKCMPLPVWN